MENMKSIVPLLLTVGLAGEAQSKPPEDFREAQRITRLMETVGALVAEVSDPKAKPGIMGIQGAEHYFEPLADKNGALLKAYTKVGEPLKTGIAIGVKAPAMFNLVDHELGHLYCEAPSGKRGKSGQRGFRNEVRDIKPDEWHCKTNAHLFYPGDGNTVVEGASSVFSISQEQAKQVMSAVTSIMEAATRSKAALPKILEQGREKYDQKRGQSK